MATPALASHVVIGAGRMGGALLSGWVSGRRKRPAPEDILILDPHMGEAAQAIAARGARHITKAGPEMSGAKVVLLAIKPQMFAGIAPALVKYIPQDCLVISILAGITLASLEAAFPGRAIVRAMPNTPAAIGAGITAYTGNDIMTPAQSKLAKRLLSSGGAVYEVESEALIDVVTAVSGSGPAYVFHMVEALEAAAIANGLPEDMAPDFARQTIIGAGMLLREDDASATDLRRAVTSPGGTTQAALDVLMGVEGLPSLMRETVNAALKRAKELGQT